MAQAYQISKAADNAEALTGWVTFDHRTYLEARNTVLGLKLAKHELL